MKKRDLIEYASIITALAGYAVTVEMCLAATSWDVLAINFMGMMAAGMFTAIFRIITGIKEEDIRENVQMRKARKARQRRRRDFPIINDPMRWEMIDEATGRHFWI